MNVTELNSHDVRYIFNNLRDSDRAEISATSWDEDCEHWAAGLIGIGNCGFVVRHGLVPTICIVAVPTWPGVWSVGCFGTNDFHHVARPFTRWIHQTFKPILLDAGAHRVECRAMASSSETNLWIESIGMKKESDLKAYGKNGEDFICYAWTKK